MKCTEFITQVLELQQLGKAQGSNLSLFDRALDITLGSDLQVLYPEPDSFTLGLEDGRIEVRQEGAFLVMPND